MPQDSSLPAIRIQNIPNYLHEFTISLTKPHATEPIQPNAISIGARLYLKSEKREGTEGSKPLESKEAGPIRKKSRNPHLKITIKLLPQEHVEFYMIKPATSAANTDTFVTIITQKEIEVISSNICTTATIIQSCYTII